MLVSLTNMNPVKFWLVIKDDAKRKFEVVEQASNTNTFTNKVYAMQKAGMSITGFTPPVGTKHSSKDSIKFTGYDREDGLYNKLQAHYHDLMIKNAAQHEDEGID
jgi:hypothetical protein